MTKTLYSCRKPARIDNLELSPYSVKDRTFVNIVDQYAVDYRAKGTSIIDVERALHGDEIYAWSFGYDIGPQMGDKWPEFKRWKEFTEKPQTIDIVPVAEEISYKTSSRERRLGDGPGENVLYVHDSEARLPINKVGLYVSKTENLRQDVNNYLATDGLITNEAQLFHKFMKSKGYNLKHDIGDFMVGGIPKRAIAAVHLKDHYFAFNKNFRNMIAKSAKAHGVSYDDEKFNTVMHELIHLYDVRSEEELENLALEFYLSLAKREPEGYVISVPKTARSQKQEYKGKARIPLLRLAARGKSPFFKNIDALVEQLYAEAREKGLDEIEAQQYVDACLKIYEKAEKADYKEGKEKDNRDSEKTDKEISKEEMAKEATDENEATETVAEDNEGASE